MIQPKRIMTKEDKANEIKTRGLTMAFSGINPYPYVNSELKKLEEENDPKE